MMTSKIEQVIDEIEDFLANCKTVPFSNSKVSVDKNELGELLEELRQKTPDEIKKYQKIISNKEAIIAEAKSQAEEILADAHAQNEKMVSEHEIMQQAYAQRDEIIADANKQAQEIVDQAVAYADEVRSGSVAYTDDMLNSMLIVMKHAMDGANDKFEEYMKSMQNSYSIVENNLKELRGTAEEEAEPAPVKPTVKAVEVPEEPEYEEEPEEEEAEAEAEPEEEQAPVLKAPKSRKKDEDDFDFDEDEDDDDEDF